ncbi:hypothetical protein HHL28_15175 [Aerophototrophica crusticola]|uniref:PilZ domain-containing protein n=1 Tax=Aerophototrophica crusticola TaxID=1709002 RepID=A0A858RAP1_9PROT|nr:hypothetical protein HHL28_15175 [Rhodospirillaceae bacterium B3]
MDLTGANLAGAQLAGTLVDCEVLAEAKNLPTGGLAQITEPPRKALSAEAFLALVAEHEALVDSSGAKGKRLDLDMADVPAVSLKGRTLSGARLRRCRFAPADWTEAQFEMADLSYSTLRGMVLDGASFRGATLRRTFFQQAHLVGASFEAQPITGGRTWPANLEGASLHEADLTNANLSGAILRGVDMVGAIVTGINMRGADLAGAKRTEAPGGKPVKQRRRLRRFMKPVLAVGSRKGMARTRNWSFGGMSLEAKPDSYQPGEVVTLLVAAPGAGEPVPVQAKVLAVDSGAASVSISFDPLTPELKAYLNGLVAERYRLA